MAAKPKQAKSDSTEIVILELTNEIIDACILGSTPLIFNRMSEKAKRQLLFPAPPMNAAEKIANMKHDPVGEYRASVYRNPGDTPATRLKFPSAAFKGAMETAALELPGATKAAIGRLVSMPNGSFDIYGRPKLIMSVVRMADIARTPDIRTRAIIDDWACQIRVQFTKPKLRRNSVANLIAAAGVVAGIGDWRQEKGSGNHGMFQLCGPDDAAFNDIVKTGARAVQDHGLDQYECYDAETEDLLGWYLNELKRRGIGAPASEPWRWAGGQTDPGEIMSADVKAGVAATQANKRARGNGNGASV